MLSGKARMLAAALMAGALVCGGTTMAQTGSKDRGNGFMEHGVAAAVSRARGIAATTGKDGKAVILVWLSDYRSCRQVLVIDADSGASRSVPFPVTQEDSPFAVLLSSKNKFYSVFGEQFVEFDPVRETCTIVGKNTGRSGMSMTEDDRGVIWSAQYPNSDLVSFDPATRTMVNYGPLNKENWAQYQRSMAVDKSGWVYVGIGNVTSHLIAFNPKTREIRPLAKPEERKQGTGYVFLGADGKVYGAPHSAGPWYVLSEGKATPTEKPTVAHAPIKTGAQETVIADFPDGRKIAAIDVPEKWVDIRAKDGTVRRLKFDYPSEGSHVMSIVLGPDGKVYGCTGHPLRVFAYDPAADAFTDHGWRNENGHWNALAVQRGRLFGAMYGGGFLFDYDVTQPWNDAAKGPTNPKILANGGSDIGRPHALLAHPDGRHLIMTGTPGYGYTGGGMMIYDLESGKSELLNHEALLPQLSTIALEPLGDGAVLVGGAATWPGTGGETRAKEGELYLMDFASRKITFHAPIIPGAAEIRDFKVGPDGLVYGLASGSVFFVFDPKAKKVVHQETVTQYGALTGGQAPRVMLFGPDKKLYVYFRDAIVRIEPGTFEHQALAKPPAPIGIGIVLRGDRLYFISGSRLWSWKVPGLK